MTTTQKHLNIALAKAPKDSSQIHSVGYDAAHNTLAIRFHGKNGPGSLYHYSNVTPEQHQEFLSAHSLGKHFAQVFKNSKEHPFTKIPEEKQ